MRLSIRHIASTLLLTGLLWSSCDNSTTEGPEASVSTPGTIEELTQVIDRDPTNAEAFVERAKFHFANKNYGDAIQDMAAAMRHDSINEQYHHLLADIYLQSLRSQLALNTMERAVRLFPQSRESRLKIAEMQIILLQFPAASANLRRVMEMSPRDVDALYLLGVLYREQNDIDKAIQSFQTVVEIDADHYEGWTMLGNLLDIQGDPNALQCFENAIAIDSTYPQGWHSKAFYLQNRGQVDEALSIYEKIHRIDSTYLDAYLNAGILHLERSEAALAETKFNRVIEMQPNNPIGHYYLGVTYESAGLLDLALKHLGQANALAPSAARFAEALERVQQKNEQ